MLLGRKPRVVPTLTNHDQNTRAFVYAAMQLSFPRSSLPLQGLSRDLWSPKSDVPLFGIERDTKRNPMINGGGRTILRLLLLNELS